MRRLAAALPLVLGALAFGACGDDDGSQRSVPATTNSTRPLVDPRCASLTDLPYESRKAAIEDLGDDRQQVEDECGDVIDATEEAAALQELTASITPSTVDFELVRCESDGIVVEASNTSIAPIHLLGTVTYFDIEDDANESSSVVSEPIPVGETVQITRERGDAPGRDRCYFAGQPFHAATSAADSTIPGETATGPTAADDPLTWLPALVEMHEAWFEDRDPDALASFLDIRSADYPWYLDGPPAGAEQPYRARWCETFPGPTEDVVIVSFRRRSEAFSYVDDDGETVEREAAHETTMAAARRGNDGAWRLLTTPVLSRRTPCAAVDEVVDELRTADLLPADADVEGLQTLEQLAALPGLSRPGRELVLERSLPG